MPNYYNTNEAMGTADAIIQLTFISNILYGILNSSCSKAKLAVFVVVSSSFISHVKVPNTLGIIHDIHAKFQALKLRV